MQKEARRRWMPPNSVKKIPTQRKFARILYDGQAIRMRWATLFAMSHRTVIDRAVNTTIINTMVMLMYVLLQHGTDAVCMPKKALGDVACTNIATHGVNYHHTWYEHEHK